MYEIQQIAVSRANAIDGTTKFSLRYNDTFGESWVTDTISTIAAGAGAANAFTAFATNIKTALNGIPNGVIQKVQPLLALPPLQLLILARLPS